MKNCTKSNTESQIKFNIELDLLENCRLLVLIANKKSLETVIPVSKLKKLIFPIILYNYRIR